MPFERGVRYYTKTYGIIDVSFPEDMTVCQYCPYLIGDRQINRSQCFITKEFIPRPNDGVGEKCPLRIESEDKNDYI